MNNLSERSSDPESQKKTPYHFSEVYDPKMDAEIYAVVLPTQGFIQKLGQSIKDSILQHQSTMERVKVYESFSDRGKSQKIKYDYSASQKTISIRIQKKYFLNTLKMKQYELLKLINGFMEVWKNCYFATIRACLKFFMDMKKQSSQKVVWDLVSIDVLAITFDLTLYGKKKYRFRISYFEFRNDLGYYTRGDSNDNNFRNSNLYMQTHQIIAFADLNFSQPKQFFRNPRLPFLEDFKIVERLYLLRIGQKFQIFYTAYTLCKPITPNQHYQFNRKVLPSIIFTSNRFHTFQLTFVFEHIYEKFKNMQQQKTKQQQHRIVPEIDQRLKRISLTFHIDDIDESEAKSKDDRQIKMGIIDHDNFLNSAYTLKPQINYSKQLLRKIYKAFFNRNEADFRMPYLSKDIKISQDKIFHKNPNIRGQREKQEEKFQKFLANLSSLVSFILDRLCFLPMEKQDIINQDSIIIELSTQLNKIPKIIHGESDSKYKYEHHFVIFVKSQYYGQVLKQQSYGFSGNMDQNRFYKLVRRTEKIDTKEDKKKNPQDKKRERELFEKEIYLHQIFKNYINQILKFYTLREGYRELISFIDSVIKVVYNDSTTQASMEKSFKGNREILLTKVINALGNLLSATETEFVKLKIIPNESNGKANYSSQLPFALVTYSIYDYRYGMVLTPKQYQGQRIIKIYDNKVELDRGGKTNTVQIGFYDQKNDQAGFFSQQNLREALKITATDYQ